MGVGEAMLGASHRGRGNLLTEAIDAVSRRFSRLSSCDS